MRSFVLFFLLLGFVFTPLFAEDIKEKPIKKECTEFVLCSEIRYVVVSEEAQTSKNYNVIKSKEISLQIGISEINYKNYKALKQQKHKPLIRLL